ncbi:hypothetical protein [Paraburkholderia sp. HD33-4]|uniref:hypothetical protein n=1 Tax=Paraburkholderia sp. HD33-4 TaxID=2883242 RepID=UPI001F2EF7CA|nr:hypothetical protein [Paraburkholderia sp. HD33-4]
MVEKDEKKPLPKGAALYLQFSARPIFQSRLPHSRSRSARRPFLAVHVKKAAMATPTTRVMMFATISISPLALTIPLGAVVVRPHQKSGDGNAQN